MTLVPLSGKVDDDNVIFLYIKLPSFFLIIAFSLHIVLAAKFVSVLIIICQLCIIYTLLSCYANNYERLKKKCKNSKLNAIIT